jgi:hypothetical protein
MISNLEVRIFCDSWLVEVNLVSVSHGEEEGMMISHEPPKSED